MMNEYMNYYNRSIGKQYNTEEFTMNDWNPGIYMNQTPYSDAKKEKEAQAEGKIEKTADSGAKGEKAQDGISGEDVQTGNIENVQKNNSAHAQNIQPIEIAAPETHFTVAQAAVYPHVDVHL